MQNNFYKWVPICICALWMAGCCSCRKTIVFVEVPYTASCSYLSVGREVRPLAPRFIPRNRRDSLLMKVMEASMKAKRETDEATRHLNPIMKENKNSPELGGVAKALYRQALSLTTINESVDSLTKQVPCQHSK